MFSFSDILGINARHLLYIKKYNGESATSFADDKLKTKRFLEARKIPVPKLLGVIRRFQELDNFQIQHLSSGIVIKPNSSSGGEGIIVLGEKTREGWRKSSGEDFTKEDFYRHCNDILSGAYSKTGQGDICLIEKRILSHDKLAAISYKGLPDIRIIVFNMVPVMAMLRLPTPASDGKANMHLGGIGAGIDIAKGEITYLTQYNNSIDEIPGIGDVRGYKIPHWDEILQMAVKTQMMTGVGYLGVDIALDKTGPLLLEMNARAGLGIQIANMAPLRKRLQMVEKLKVKSIEKGIRIAKDLFGRQIDRDIENLSGKKVVGTKEYVKLYFKEGPKELLAKIDPSVQENFMEESLYQQIAKVKPHLLLDDGLRIKYSILEDKTKTIFKPQVIENKPYQIILGRRALNGYLIDPYKYKLSEAPEKSTPYIISFANTEEKKIQDLVEQWKPIDNDLYDLEKAILKNFSIRPLNYRDEMQHFIEAKGHYNPQFIYKSHDDVYGDIKKKLRQINIDDHEIQGKIFLDKKEELETKLDLYYEIGKDAEKFTFLSTELFLPIEQSLLEEAQTHIMKNKSDFFPSKNDHTYLDLQEIQRAIHGYFKKYKLKKWNILLKEDIAARISVAKSNKRLLYLSKQIKLSPDELEATLAHEIETHVLRLENGLQQPFHIFITGLKNYLLTEEGLAIYNQENILKKITNIPQLKDNNAAQNYLKTARVLGQSFEEAAQKYEERLLKTGTLTDKDYESIFRKVFRTKRGLADTSKHGGLTKDLLYFAGYKKINDYILNGGNIKNLYFGKISVESVPDVLYMEELKQPKILPDFLRL